ncbi:DUF692 domain-containing protein [Vibrio cholerae]|nr:DUF692 domain-containing protein [Vibrio cholerae]EKF9159974.1 DUF692 domain-containing protein [Vibrio cholerae]
MMNSKTIYRLPPSIGVGLKPEHVQTILDTQPEMGFFEVHAENYMVAGGPFHHHLEQIRTNYPLSIHGVGLSIGGEGALDDDHLERLATLIKRYQPEAFSEHLAWSSHQGTFLNDLLPAPYHEKTLLRVCEHIDRVQEKLGYRMLLENPATYVEFSSSDLREEEFICEVVKRTGCGLLLDVNNVYVSCVNHGRNVASYLQALPLFAVGEIHLAGYAEDVDSLGSPLLIDSHGAPISKDVWNWYRFVIELIGPKPTLIERDNNIPPFAVLAAEAKQAQEIMDEVKVKL